MSSSHHRESATIWPMCIRRLIVALGLCTLIGCGSNRSSPGEWQGRVVSNGEPVGGATVRVPGTARSVQTDEDGLFRLPRAANERTTRITAAKPGYIIGGTDVDKTSPMTIPLEPLPARDNDAYAWVDPRPNRDASQNCGNCHREIFEQWRHGGHAGAASNPRFLDLYAGTTWQSEHEAGWSLLRDYPEGAGVCLACHAPAARMDELGIADIRQLEGIANQGVHCDFCHKVRQVTTENVGLTHGRFAMELLRPEHGQLFFGPLDDVDRSENSYSWLPLMSESRFCASCHEGIVFGVPVYTTYSEWLASPARRAGKQCQSCHMHPDGTLTNIAPGAGGLERDPMTLASHSLMPGGREAMLRNCLNVTTFWHNDSPATLTISIRTQDVGHRVPTGFVDRHLMLVVDARDAAGDAVDLQSGPRLPDAAGELAGSAGTLFAKLLRGTSGDAPVPFWHAGTIIEDTRLHPDRDHAFAFRFEQAPTRVHVRLLYRKFWKQVADEKNWPDETIVVHALEVAGPTATPWPDKNVRNSPPSPRRELREKSKFPQVASPQLMMGRGVGGEGRSDNDNPCATNSHRRAPCLECLFIRPATPSPSEQRSHLPESSTGRGPVGAVRCLPLVAGADRLDRRQRLLILPVAKYGPRLDPAAVLRRRVGS